MNGTKAEDQNPKCHSSIEMSALFDKASLGIQQQPKLWAKWESHPKEHHGQHQDRAAELCFLSELRELDVRWRFFYSRNATDCTPATSKRLRQRRFLQATMSSLRTI